MGTNMRLTRVAAGQIFQFVSIVSPILDLACSTPPLALAPLKSLTQFAKIKKPVRKMGAKASWSKSMPTNAGLNVEGVVPTTLVTT